MTTQRASGDPPRDNLIRALRPGFTLRADEDGGMPTLVTTPVVFNRWTEIDSWFEGNFMERIAPGATKKTIRENRDAIKVLFQHGHDPQVGDKPLGVPNVLREGTDDNGTPGLIAEVPLFDTSYNRDLVPGLEARAYGASFRFRVMKEELDEDPGTSESNPRGIPERTIKELRLFEFGPVTFPAYPDATAGLRGDEVRSLTDHFLLDRLSPEATERLRSYLDAKQNPRGIIVPRNLDDGVEENEALLESGAALPETEPTVGEVTPDDESRDATDVDDAAEEEEPTEPAKPVEFWFAQGDDDGPIGRRRGEDLLVLTRRP